MNQTLQDSLQFGIAKVKNIEKAYKTSKDSLNSLQIFENCSNDLETYKTIETQSTIIYNDRNHIKMLTIIREIGNSIKVLKVNVKLKMQNWKILL